MALVTLGQAVKKRSGSDEDCIPGCIGLLPGASPNASPDWESWLLLVLNHWSPTGGAEEVCELLLARFRLKLLQPLR